MSLNNALDNQQEHPDNNRMEDGKIYFKVPTPGQLKLDDKVFESFDDFITVWSTELSKWDEVKRRTLGNQFLWNIFETFRGCIKDGINSKDASKINASIIDYYMSRAGDDKVFYPSWTSIGKLLTKNYGDNAEFEGCVFAIYPKSALAHLSSLSETKRIAAFINAYLLKSGVPLPQLDDFYGEAKKFELEQASVIAATRKRMQEMEEFYDTRMKLKSPVLYWNKKAKRHMQRRNGAVILTFISALLGAGLLFCYLIRGHDFLKEEMHGWPWAFVCGFLLLASFVFWAVRFFARIYNQQEALYNDAREREVMAKTFIALTSDEATKRAITKDEHIGIVLTSLFRPATCSFSNDGPVAPYETVVNVIKKTSE
jgi:hypothetical protein